MVGHYNFTMYVAVPLPAKKLHDAASKYLNGLQVVKAFHEGLL